MFGISIDIPVLQYQSDTVCCDTLLESIKGKYFI